MQIEFTEQELKQLIGLIDVTVRAGGLQAAQVWLPLAQKLSEPLKKGG